MSRAIFQNFIVKSPHCNLTIGGRVKSFSSTTESWGSTHRTACDSKFSAFCLPEWSPNAHTCSSVQKKICICARNRPPLTIFTMATYSIRKSSQNFHLLTSCHSLWREGGNWFAAWYWQTVKGVWNLGRGHDFFHKPFTLAKKVCH